MTVNFSFVVGERILFQMQRSYASYASYATVLPFTRSDYDRDNGTFTRTRV